jgi:hypothetical protein
LVVDDHSARTGLEDHGRRPRRTCQRPTKRVMRAAAVVCTIRHRGGAGLSGDAESALDGLGNPSETACRHRFFTMAVCGMPHPRTISRLIPRSCSNAKTADDLSQSGLHNVYRYARNQSLTASLLGRKHSEAAPRRLPHLQAGFPELPRHDMLTIHRTNLLTRLRDTTQTRRGNSYEYFTAADTNTPNTWAVGDGSRPAQCRQ